MSTFLTALSLLPVPAVLVALYVTMSPRYSKRARHIVIRVVYGTIAMSGLAYLVGGFLFFGSVLIVIAALPLADPYVVRWIAARRDAKQAKQ
ncbi:hypothetical protein AB0N09_05205 [Streptomyces erythrochromogenes]|uniref:hypothetical protein n=1 Tax=Streptomyces erythrochromogenes TaxID=285574 RepID=UPI003429AC80